jgi:hypothetical protein
MKKKQIFVTLAQAFLDNYDRELKIYDALNNFNITAYDDNKPLVKAAEDILCGMTKNEYTIDFLLDFYNDGEVVFYISPEDVNDKEEIITCTSIDELWDYLMG